MTSQVNERGQILNICKVCIAWWARCTIDCGTSDCGDVETSDEETSESSGLDEVDEDIDVNE